MSASSDTSQVLLQVDADPPPSLIQFPPDPRNPWSPLWAVPNAVANTASLAGGVLDTALALRIRGFEAHRSLDGLKAMGVKAREKLKGVFPDWLPSRGQTPNALAVQNALEGLPTLFFDSVTLKQFRNPEDPSLACYQALVNSSMGVDRVNRAGLLGDSNLLRGATSGGYSVRIHQLDSQPIIETLGLLVDSWSDGDGDTPGATATFKPVLPAWLDVDLYYGIGNLICSRAHGSMTSPAGYWLDEEKNVPVPTDASTAAAPPYYNNALGAATQPITGPFHFPDVTVQVYPLLADRDKLEEVLENYLNNPLSEMISPSGQPQKGWRFESFGSCVYMMVTVYGEEFGQMWSGTNNIGGFFDREVTFCIPVKWYDENGELISVAVIEPFTFSNNDRAVATDREVNGYNTVKATIDSPRDIWLESNGPAARRRLLEMQIEVIPALNLGQKAEQRPLLEIDEQHTPAADDEAGWRNVADTWGRDLIGDLKRKTYLATTQVEDVIGGKALALELLAYQAPLNRIILKQYRDGEQLTRACYQALVHASSTITSVYDIREISPHVSVRLYRQPGNLIAEALGLKVKCQQSAGGEVIDVLQPVRPFWMRLGLKEDLATVACFRAKDEPWQIVHPWFETPAPTPATSAAVPEEAPRSQLSFDPPPAPPRRLAGQKPYFKQSGATRVGAWLANVPGDASLPALGGQTASPAQPCEDVDWPPPPSYGADPSPNRTFQGEPFSDVPPRPTGDTLALFADAGDVLAWLAVRLNSETIGANLHLDVRPQSQDWLRRSLINELAWIRVSIQGCIQELLAQPANAPVAALLRCEIAPSAMMVMTEQFTMNELSELKDTALSLLRGACDQGAMADTSSLADYEKIFRQNLQTISDHFYTFFEESTKGIRERGLAWSWDDYLNGLITARVLQDSITNFEQLGHKSRHAFLMTLPKAAYPLLLEGGEFIAGPQYAFDTTFQDYMDVAFSKIESVRGNIERTGILADVIERGMLDWMKPSRWRRYSYGEAARAINSLDDVQLVIDNILSSEWENRGESARFLNPKGGRQPDEAVVLEHQLEPFAATQGLQRWIDPVTAQASNLWVEPIPGRSDSIAATGSAVAYGYQASTGPESTDVDAAGPGGEPSPSPPPTIDSATA